MVLLKVVVPSGLLSLADCRRWLKNEHVYFLNIGREARQSQEKGNGAHAHDAGEPEDRRALLVTSAESGLPCPADRLPLKSKRLCSFP